MLRCDPRRAAEVLGWRPEVDLPTGLGRVRDWMAVAAGHGRHGPLMASAVRRCAWRSTAARRSGPTFLPYARQVIDDSDVAAVSEALRSDWLTTGPRVPAFEDALEAATGARHAVAFSSGTAALHGAAVVAGLGPGDEAITTPMTFVATANAVLYAGATPVFADVGRTTC